MTTALWIALGSAVGGVLRYWCSGLVARWFGETFPWGTLLVNVGGSLLIGLFATLSAPDGRLLIGSAARQFVMLGLLGGFTTFSSSACRPWRWPRTANGCGRAPTSSARSCCA